MAAPAHRDEQVVRPCEHHCLRHVRRADTARDERRLPVDGAIPYLARLVVAGLTGDDKFATEARLQVRRVRGGERRLLAVASHDGDLVGYPGGGEDAPEGRGARGCQRERGSAKGSSLHTRTPLARRRQSSISDRSRDRFDSRLDSLSH